MLVLSLTFASVFIPNAHAACASAAIDSTSPTNFKVLELVPDGATNKFTVVPLTGVLSLSGGQTLADGLEAAFPGQSGAIFGTSRTWSCIYDSKIVDCWGCGRTCTCVIVIGDRALENIGPTGNP